jgi:hypothetical protein
MVYAKFGRHADAANMLDTFSRSPGSSPLTAIIYAQWGDTARALDLLETAMRHLGKFTISRRSRAVGWLATSVMAVASLGFIVSFGFS